VSSADTGEAWPATTDAGGSAERAALIAVRDEVAKAVVGQSCRFVAQQAVQLHGGMGMTDELNVGHYFKRIAAINVQFGDPSYHLTRYARQQEPVHA